MSNSVPDVDPYELLEVSIDATESEIKTAYRQRSLKVHPDRHPGNPDAAQKFHELNQAYELLLDPIRKTSLDAKFRANLARKQRFANFDAKRRGMQADLEMAENAAKRAKMNKEKSDLERKEEEDRVKEEGRRMREKKQDEILRAEVRMNQTVKQQVQTIHLGPLDTTIRLKYRLSQRPTLTTPDSLSVLLSAFGPVDENLIVISLKPSKKAPNKLPTQATALVTFKNIGDAHAAICASGNINKGMEYIEVSWAGGKEPNKSTMHSHENRDHGPSDPPKSQQPSTTRQFVASEKSHISLPSFSFDASNLRPSSVSENIPGLDYESLTLMRLRQAERERLEREIREQDAATE